MSRTYTGVVVSVDATESSPQVHVELGARRIALRASVRTALAAIPLVGRRVRFQAELSEHTQCLTSPVFVIGSAYGLRAVGEDVIETKPFRVAPGPDGVPLVKSGGTRAR
jgi:hypothetical protein